MADASQANLDTPSPTPKDDRESNGQDPIIISIDDVPKEPITSSYKTRDDASEAWKGPVVREPKAVKIDLSGGRAGKIIETPEDRLRKEEILKEFETGERTFPQWWLEDQELAELDDEDIDTSQSVPTYDSYDSESKFDSTDPNFIPDPENYVATSSQDEYDPILGPYEAIDHRTRMGYVDSYMVDENTRNETLQTPLFHPGDPETDENKDFVQYRRSLDIIETYIDPFLPDDPVPRHVAQWHGYPEATEYERKNYTNNRFTLPEDLTNFDEMDPFRARTYAVELARSKNTEWMTEDYSHAWHKSQREPYEAVGTLVGTLQKGYCDPNKVAKLKPVLEVLGPTADLLSIENDRVYRFHYRGLIKNKYGISCWAKSMIEDCGLEVTGVVFETGFRQRDPLYDSGDPFYELL